MKKSLTRVLNWKKFVVSGAVLLAGLGMLTMFPSLNLVTFYATIPGFVSFFVVGVFLAKSGVSTVLDEVKLSLPKEGARLVDTVMDWLIWAVSFIVVAFLSPANASYSSVLGLLSLALGFGLLHAALDFFDEKIDETEGLK